jgi:hypothetical protein
MDTELLNTEKRRKTDTGESTQHINTNQAWPYDPLVGGGRETPTTTTQNRTVEVVLPPSDKPYSITDLLNSFKDENITETDIEAIGPQKSNTVWHVCFFDEEIAGHVLAFDSFKVRNQSANIHPLSEQTYKIRVHWTPYWLSNDEIILKLQEKDINVINAFHETYPGTNMRTMVRIFIVKTNVLSNIPYFLSLREGHEVFVTMRHRPFMCLHCRQLGHTSKTCTKKQQTENINSDDTITRMDTC